jgi:competence protein ComFC
MLPQSFSRDPQPEARQMPGLLLSDDPVRRWLALGLDLLFPPRCAGCGKVDTIWCAVCQQAVEGIAFPPLRSLASDSPLTAVAATAPHEGRVQQALWSLKYENGYQLALPLGERLAARLRALGWTIDIIVPVPLHIHRLKTRGYNQAELLANSMATRLESPLESGAVERQIETRSQVGLNAEERKANMQQAFRAEPQLVSGKTVLLVDDVYTTGATLEACARAVLEAGATAVFGLTVTMA